MKFALNEDQQALDEATKDFFASKCSSDSTRKAIVTDSGYDEQLFASLCSELGLASLVIEEEYGGFGASDVELAVVLEHHGYFLAPTPLRSHVEAIIAVQECASTQFRGGHLARLSTGESLSSAVFSDDDFTVTLDESENGLMISGRFARVPFGASIQSLYFPLRVNSQIVLAHLDCNQDPVSKFVTPSIDQTQPLGAIEVENAVVTIISEDATHSIARARSRAIVAICNEMVGSTQAILDMSVAYAKDRFQFGRAIGSFQAIKHKCADMLLETESARSIALFGAWLASQGADFESDELEDDLSHIASMAKYYCSRALSHAAGENIQIHGGIGFTMEHDAQLFFKRAAYMNAYLGLPSAHGAILTSQLEIRNSLKGKV